MEEPPLNSTNAACEAEVTDFDNALLGEDDDVLQLKITVHNSSLNEGVSRLGAVRNAYDNGSLLLPCACNTRPKSLGTSRSSLGVLSLVLFSARVEAEMGNKF